MAGDDGKFPEVTATIASSTVSSLGVAVSTSAAAGVHAHIVVQPPVISIAPPNHPIYALIGRAASAWAHFEHTLDLIIWDLLGVDQAKAACASASVMGATNRYKIIISLLRQRKHRKSDDLIESVEKLMRKTYDPTEDRNRIVHDPWYLYDTDVAQFRAMPAKDPKFGVCKVDTNDIERFLKTANEVSEKAAFLRQQIIVALAT